MTLLVGTGLSRYEIRLKIGETEDGSAVNLDE
jgi:hypothetical protein